MLDEAVSLNVIIRATTMNFPYDICSPDAEGFIFATNFATFVAICGVQSRFLQVLQQNIGIVFFPEMAVFEQEC